MDHDTGDTDALAVTILPYQRALQRGVGELRDDMGRCLQEGGSPMSRRRPFLFALVALLACEGGSVGVEPPADEADPLMQAGLFNNVTISLNPPYALATAGDTVRFTATVQEGSDTLDVSLDWSVMDTTVAQVDSSGLVTALNGGFAVLVVRWGMALAAAAIIADEPVVTFRSGHVSQGVLGGRPFIAGRPVFAQTIITADRENDWHPTAMVEIRSFPGNTSDTVSMTSPVGGIPTGLRWDDYDLVDSTFHAIIPGNSVQPGFQHISVDWNIHDDHSSGYGADAVDPPPFHLVIVPVIWDSLPDHRILEWTEHLTADSSRIVGIQDMLPVRPGYRVSVLEPFNTQQDLTTGSGWIGLILEIDSIRATDGQRAYYYGAFGLPVGSPYGGMAWGPYPVSIGALTNRVITHEIGHNMGLLHAPCGGVSSSDPDFPYQDGRIGRWGYSFQSRTFKNPEQFHDVMSYCGPNWISDYHFNKALAYRLEHEPNWWGAQADMERPPIIADPVGGLPVNDSVR